MEEDGIDIILQRNKLVGNGTHDFLLFGFEGSLELHVGDIDVSISFGISLWISVV
jgi:hypothetical protein